MDSGIHEVKQEQGPAELTGNNPHCSDAVQQTEVKTERPEIKVEQLQEHDAASMMGELPSFGVTMVPSMEQTIAPGSGTAVVQTTGVDGSRQDMPTSIHANQQPPAPQKAEDVNVIQTMAVTRWQDTITVEQRRKIVIDLVNVFKSKNNINADDRVLLGLARRVEDAWFARAQTKEQYLDHSLMSRNFQSMIAKLAKKRPREDTSHIGPAQGMQQRMAHQVAGEMRQNTGFGVSNAARPSGNQYMSTHGQYMHQSGSNVGYSAPQQSGYPMISTQVVNQNMPYSSQVQPGTYQYQGQVPMQPMMQTSVYQTPGVQQNTSQAQYMSNGAPVLLRGSTPAGQMQPSHGVAVAPPQPSNSGTATSQSYFIRSEQRPDNNQQQMIPITDAGGAPQPMVPVTDQAAESRKQSFDATLRSEVPKSGNTAERKTQILTQQKWLLFLRHCAKCTLSPDQCQYKNSCATTKKLWEHLIRCKEKNCKYPRCEPSRALLMHHQQCKSRDCPVCIPVKQYVARQRESVQNDKLARSGLTEAEQKKQIEMAKARRAELQRKHVIAQAHSTGDLSVPIVNTDTKPKLNLKSNMGTSLIEFFTVEEIEKHLSMLRISDVPAKPAVPAKKSNSTSNLVDLPPLIEEESQCKLCNHNKLLFEPQALYCYSCGVKISRNQLYYASPPDCDIRATWCSNCVRNSKEKLMLESFTIKKEQLVKNKNTFVAEEAWVQCDYCEGWVHQICGMFNKGRNDDSRGFFCPECLLASLKAGTRSIPETRPQAMLTAKDLARCRLSDVLESRLHKVMEKDKEQRIKEGVDPKDIEDFPLFVRVVNNVEKKLEVTPLFAKEFCQDGRPDAYMYKQKVILLFQRVEGVDMCLFCMYVQEYGDDCPAPNNRTVYLSYLDSVKYFQPEGTQAMGLGIALRTLAYHELLMGYLQDVKERGFCAMYIWACPPMQGDDYIFYCHPGKQKVPRSDRLREWYLSMLNKSKSENTVVYISNLVDTFFEGGRDHRLEKPSVADLPYLAGDYWPGEAERLLAQGDAGISSGSMKGKKEKRLRLPDGAGPGQILLAQLAEYADMQKMKEDFIVAHLYESCSHCRVYINGSARYYHPNPPQKVTIKSEKVFDGISLDKPGTSSSKSVSLTRFQLCEKCYLREGNQLEDEKPLGLPNGISLSDLVEEQCPIIPPNQDDDPTMDSEFFDTRQQFLSLCQGNHYQFDTLRRARHSSMMALYHLHNPSEPAFSATCNVCQGEVQPGQGYRCSQCPDFDMCSTCYQNPLVTHQHPLTAPEKKKFDETCMRLTQEEQRKRENALKEMLRVLLHSSQCRDCECKSALCLKFKNLFRHANDCRTRLTGGCQYCRKLWQFLQLHAKMCTQSNCPVPRCAELRALRRQQVARQEEKRREAYRRMMEQQLNPTT
ncbi:hypothetical protein M9435_005806 [Picochlorum sp. BPE23]|nr:hypothetical protein M9435_005806 [Picochlorum sp. BPE23]